MHAQNIEVNLGRKPQLPWQCGIKWSQVVTLRAPYCLRPKSTPINLILNETFDPKYLAIQISQRFTKGALKKLHLKSRFSQELFLALIFQRAPKNYLKGIGG